MASGALPPGFPPIEIDDEHYSDGGLVSNTPLQPRSANSLRSATCTLGRSEVSTMASSRWPRAAARLIEVDEASVKSAPPEMTALVALAPGDNHDLDIATMLAEEIEVFGDIAERDADRRIRQNDVCELRGLCLRR
jgi:predicted acylesterase/phospholipase RssA